MQYYSGLDLSARTCQVCVIDEKISVLVQKNVSNELPQVIKLLEPYKDNLQTVVESVPPTGTGLSMGCRRRNVVSSSVPALSPHDDEDNRNMSATVNASAPPRPA